MIGMTRMTGMNVVIRMTGMTGMTKEPRKTWNKGDLDSGMIGVTRMTNVTGITTAVG